MDIGPAEDSTTSSREEERPDFEAANREFRSWYGDTFTLLRVAEKTFRNLIQLLLASDPDVPSPKVSSRVKDRDECVKKFQRRYQAKLEKEGTPYQIKRHITDLIGIRVMCLYESNIDPIVRRLQSEFDVIDITDKTSELEREDDRFGYKGLHLDLRLAPDRGKLSEYVNIRDFQFEVQVRTIVQDAWSEIDHKLKYKKDLPSDLRRRVFTLAGLFELADREFDAIRAATQKLMASSLSHDFDPNELLTPFNLFQILRKYFPRYPFDEIKVEGFLDDIRELKPDVSVGEFSEAMATHFDGVSEYRDWSVENVGRNLNPYTEIRHVLYAYRPAIFQDLVFEKARRTFDRWRMDGTTFRAE